VSARRLDRGLWVILATPFDPDGAVDHTSLRRQVRMARADGADGLVALGVFGEAASLSLVEQRSVAESVVAEAAGTPVLLGVSGRGTAVAVEQAANALDGAEAAGAAPGQLSVMVQVNSGDPTVLNRHLAVIHGETGVSVVLQDYPATSGVTITPRAVLAVLEGCEFIAAVKAEAPPTPAAIGTLTAATGVPVFGGLGGVGLVDELSMGAAGAMTGFSHPQGLRATIDAFSEGGFLAARDAWAPWLPLANFEAQQGIALALRKMLMHRRGILDHPAVRPPAPTVPEHLLRLLDQHLAAAPGGGTNPTGEH
jgi:4-hydroxy-tetrahydrodipicolinate synthase